MKAFSRSFSSVSSSLSRLSRRSRTDQSDQPPQVQEVVAIIDAGVLANVVPAMRPKSSWFLMAVTAVLVAVACWQFSVREQRKQDKLREDITSIAAQYAESIRGEVACSTQAARVLASFTLLRGPSGLTSVDWTMVADTVLSRYPCISHMQFMPFAVLQYSRPLDGFEGDIGLAELVDPRYVQSAMAQAASANLSVSGPLRLARAGVAVVAQYSVYTPWSPRNVPRVGAWWPGWNHPCCPGLETPANVSFPGRDKVQGLPTWFWGFARTISKVDRLLARANLQVLNDKYRFQLVERKPSSTIDPGGVFYHSPDTGPGVTLDRPVVANVDFDDGNVHWEFRLTPLNGWPPVSTDFVINLVLLLASALLSIASRVLSLSTKHMVKAVKDKLGAIYTKTETLMPPEPPLACKGEVAVAAKEDVTWA